MRSVTSDAPNETKALSVVKKIEVATATAQRYPFIRGVKKNIAFNCKN